MKLYTIECDPACGFMVRSHDQNEAMDIGKEHAMSAHGKRMSSAEIKDMMKES